jgi:hypothetical protein
MICKDLEGIIPPGGIGEGGAEIRDQESGIRGPLPCFADCFQCAPGEWNSLHEVAGRDCGFPGPEI